MLQETGDLPDGQRPLHALNRLGFGPRPGDLERVGAIGVDRFIEEQLHPETLGEPAGLKDQIAALRTLRMTPVELFVQFQLPVRNIGKNDIEAKKAARKRSRVIIEQAVRARIIRAVHGPRQLQEVMTAFWFNHFNVFAGKGLCHLWTGAYEEEAIRPHTMGNFRTLLGATAKHPAMLFYLDNWQNTAPNSPGRRGKFDGINENYGRELMELHTLGVNGGYTQQDVIALAHILTGWTIMRSNPARMMRNHRRRFAGRFSRFGGFRRFGSAGENNGDGTNPHRFGSPLMADAAADQDGFLFDPRRHDFTDKVFLHQHIKGAGIEEGEHALDLLACSRATANHLSYELAQYFVADAPPQPLVARMAARYLASDGDIGAVLKTMFTSPEFWDRRNYGHKFKTPYEYVISAARATGVTVRNARPLAGMMAQMGQPLYGCQTPDGYRNEQQAWLNPEAMMMRLSFATALGAGRLPLGRPALDDVADEGRMDDVGGAMVRTVAMDEPRGRAFKMEPPDPARLASTLGDLFSSRTDDAVMAAPPSLHAPLILGSPEFMMR
ncbi:MAG: DUF1800 domain-containing protein [Candidatus Binataceae bacterium]